MTITRNTISIAESFFGDSLLLVQLSDDYEQNDQNNQSGYAYQVHYHDVHLPKIILL
jgi:hypothetical protein